MHERLGYWLFRSMGVEAPRSVHARLVINGEFIGLYALTEQIDGAFTDYHFDDKDGNLYKEVWPLNMNGEPMDSQSLITALKTNEDDNPSTDIISGFADKLYNGKESDIPNIISEYMDINKVPMTTRMSIEQRFKKCPDNLNSFDDAFLEGFENKLVQWRNIKEFDSQFKKYDFETYLKPQNRYIHIRINRTFQIRIQNQL